MAQHRTNPVVRLLPSLTDVAFLLPVVFLFTRMEGAKTMLGDGDTGWHIRTGEWILANGHVPTKDMFSFTKAGAPWYAWEWLWDMCIAWIYHHGGLASVVVVNIALICLTFALLFRLVRRHCINPFLAMAITSLACATSALHWLARPHLITMLFVVISLFVLDRVREGRTRWVLVLPFFTILWTNLHGGFFVELIILGGYTTGELVAALLTADTVQRRTSLRNAALCAVTAACCALATLVNPYTYHLHQHIYQFFSEPYHVQNIAEYQSISFHGGGALYVEAMLLLGALTSVWFAVKHRDFVPAVLIVGWGHLALFAARNIPLFAIVSAPFIAQALNEMIHSLERAPVADWLVRTLSAFRNTAFEFEQTDRLWRLHAISAVTITVLALLIMDPNAGKKLKPEYDPDRYPAKALSVLRADRGSRIFADDEWGDYLLFQLYPDHRVFVDGRDDFYGQDFEQKYLDEVEVKYDWERYLNEYKVDTVVLSTKSSLATVIKESSHWRPIYDDTIAIVFKAAPQHDQRLSNAASSRKDRDPRITKAVTPDHRSGRFNKTKGA